MMKKLLIFVLLLIFSIPAYSNEFEKAYAGGGNVLVYFYSPSCKSCDKFNPYYDKIVKEHKELKCVRLDIDNDENLRLFKRYHGLYIPYLILTSSKSNKTVSISYNCAMNDMCLQRVIKNFKD